MEANTHQHVLTFDKGLTTIPSDLACSDDTLSSADGIVLTNSEYKAIQAPVIFSSVIPTGQQLMFVHTLNNGTKHYLTSSGQTIHAYNESGAAMEVTISVGAAIKQINAVGNTLIVNTDKGLRYYLWKGGGYNYLGDKIPEPNIRFTLLNRTQKYGQQERPYQYYVKSSLAAFENIDENETRLVITTEYGSKDLENVILGLYSELKTKSHKCKCFINPFMIRYAVELYDGTFVLASNPVLMLPSVSNSLRFTTTTNGFIYATTYHSRIAYSCEMQNIYEGWGDIIKDIVVFASPEIELYDTEDIHPQGNWGNVSPTESRYTFNKVGITLDRVVGGRYEKFEGTGYSMLSEKESADIIDDIATTSLFYRIATIPKNSTDGFQLLDIRDKVIENLTTQQRLEHDDFYYRCSLMAGKIDTFNRRLNIIAPKRGFFSGYSNFCYRTDGNSHYYKIEVEIQTPSATTNVVKYVTTDELYHPNMWFYYPDTRAKYVTITCGSTVILQRAKLKEHQYLNGAYYIGSEIPVSIDSLPTGTGEDKYTATPAFEPLPNYLLQSEVDNPFTFLASGYVRVGQGTIIGMAGLTTALNQDAYKVATTLAFTTQGIWALSINAEGQYTGVNPPFSREVCNNPSSITMTDNAVFFTSERGLMCVTGTSESSVVCVSEALSDSEFVSFCRTALIAYDYKEQLLLIFQPGSAKVYIYSIRSHAWTADNNFFEKASRADAPGASDKSFLTSVVDYPDTILQTADHKAYSLLERPNRNEDSTKYTCSFTSRPLKFDASLVQKSLRQLKHLVTPDVTLCLTDTEFGLDPGTPKMLLTIEASDDLRTWYPLQSLRGRGYRFFRFRFDFKNLHASSAFSGIVVMLQHRYTEKLR